MQPWTGYHHRGSDAAAGPGVTVGHIGGCLFVSGGDELDAWLALQPVQSMVKLNPGQAKDYPDSFQVQRFGQRLASSHSSHSFSFLFNGLPDYAAA